MSVAPHTWDPQRYAQNAAFVAAGGAPLLELLAPRPGEHILDLGCGDGVLTRKLADTGALVTGLDASEPMLISARRAFPELKFEFGSADALTYESEFDAIFSNAALHWVPRADDVARGMFRALRPGGRFVAEFGGYGNVQVVRDAVARAAAKLGLQQIPRPFAPWYFPRLGEYGALLEGAGFEVSAAWLFPRPSPMPDSAERRGIAEWLAIFAGSYFAQLSELERAALFDEVARLAEPQLFRDGMWWLDYVRLRVVARRP